MKHWLIAFRLKRLNRRLMRRMKKCGLGWVIPNWRKERNEMSTRELAKRLERGERWMIDRERLEKRMKTNYVGLSNEGMERIHKALDEYEKEKPQ